ncbi:MAG: hypothetical protein HY098_09160 [Nitrospinae bacterium]|nr:hypothetical protein [Nitrospinota bacterium]
MRGRFVLGCLFAVLFCMLKPAMAHEHCNVGTDRLAHHAKLDVSGEIPDPNAQAGSYSGLHSSVCGMRHMTSTKHCNMGDCYLGCGEAKSSSVTNISAAQEFAESNATAYFHDFYQFQFHPLTREPALQISIQPDPRPPAA